MKNISNKVTGAIFVILGILCMVFPILSSIWVELVVGACFIAGAMISLFKISSGEGIGGKLYWVALAILYGIAGVFMLLNPVVGMMAIMLALGVVFLLEGVFSLVYWADKKCEMKYPVLALINGLITLLLGVLVVSNIDSGIMFIGFLVGLDFLFSGVAMFSPQVKTEAQV